MAQKAKRDWFIAGAQILAEAGPQKMTVDALCQAVGVTKGSFYHHFGGIDDYVTSFLIYFEQEGTLQIIDRVENEPTPETKIRKLIEISTAERPVLEASLRAWANHDARVRTLFERVDRRRRDYVTALWRPLVPDEATAQTRGGMMYAMLVGSEHMWPPMSHEAVRAMFAAYLEAFEL